MHYHQLTLVERYQIYALYKAGLNQKQIADKLNRSASTISRELRRNKTEQFYRPSEADGLATKRRRQAKKARKVTEPIRRWIKKLIKTRLSPAQVALYLNNDHGIKLHHETLYRLIYADKAAGGYLYQHLRIANKSHRKRYGTYQRRSVIKNRKWIDERPAIVDKRGRIGDWEGDTMIGKDRKSVLLTLVERSTLYTLIVRLKGKHADEVANAAIKHLMPFKDKVKTITFDNGLEFAHHHKIAKQLETAIYFAHPYASWERGINENTNGLIRQYFPKGTDFSQLTVKQIKNAMYELNNRPRLTRKGKTPNELFTGQRVDLLAA